MKRPTLKYLKGINDGVLALTLEWALENAKAEEATVNAYILPENRKYLWAQPTRRFWEPFLMDGLSRLKWCIPSLLDEVYEHTRLIPHGATEALRVASSTKLSKDTTVLDAMDALSGWIDNTKNPEDLHRRCNLMLDLRRGLRALSRARDGNRGKEGREKISIVTIDERTNTRTVLPDVVERYQKNANSVASREGRALPFPNLGKPDTPTDPPARQEPRLKLPEASVPPERQVGRVEFDVPAPEFKAAETQWTPLDAAQEVLDALKEVLQKSCSRDLQLEDLRKENALLREENSRLQGALQEAAEKHGALLRSNLALRNAVGAMQAALKGAAETL
jgi:hypothetical protein